METATLCTHKSMTSNNVNTGLNLKYILGLSLTINEKLITHVTTNTIYVVYFIHLIRGIWL